MKDDLNKILESDPDGLMTYEYIANHIESCDEIFDALINNMVRVDLNGQFLVSTARYLNAIDPNHYRQVIDRLIENAISHDREHRYIGSLLPEIWGEDYAERAAELSAADNNFRRIYKRMNPSGF